MIGLLTPAEYNDRVEHAFRMHGLGRVAASSRGGSRKSRLSSPQPFSTTCERGRLVAVWTSHAELEQYIAEVEVPRGRELMRKVGVEPTMTVVDVLEHA